MTMATMRLGTTMGRRQWANDEGPATSRAPERARPTVQHNNQQMRTAGGEGGERVGLLGGMGRQNGRVRIN
jgi:hypothetical protein